MERLVFSESLLKLLRLLKEKPRMCHEIISYMARVKNCANLTTLKRAMSMGLVASGDALPEEQKYWAERKYYITPLGIKLLETLEEIADNMSRRKRNGRKNTTGART